MKRCPYCGADNHDTAVACYNCGRDISAVAPAADSPEPTQPRRVTPPPQGAASYPSSPYDTQPLPYYPPLGRQLPGQPPDSQQQPPNYPPQDTQPGQTYYPPAYGQPPTYARASYPPPPPPPEPRRRGSCAWSLFGGVLGLALICVMGLVVLSITGAGSAIAARLRGQVATQVVDAFNIPTPTPQATSPFEEASPTPWPTFTPAAPAPGETVTPDATQQAYIDKLLSPGCKSALETLGQDSNTVTQDPLKLLDDTWRAGLTQAMTEMKTNCGSLDAASPVPGQVGKLNQSITTANNDFDQAKQLWTEAVDNRDPSKALQAAQLIGAAAKSLSQALAEIKALAP